MEKYLINIKTGNLFIRTPELVLEADMAACDKNGKITGELLSCTPETVLTPPVEPGEIIPGDGEGVLSREPTLDDFKETLCGMDIDELKSKAEGLGISYSPRIGEDTLRARIIKEVEERLSGGE